MGEGETRVVRHHRLEHGHRAGEVARVLASLGGSVSFVAGIHGRHLGAVGQSAGNDADRPREYRAMAEPGESGWANRLRTTGRAGEGVRPR